MGFGVKHLLKVVTHLGLGGILSICGVLPCLAGGYTQPKGFTFTALGINTYDTDTYHKLEIQAYLEHGLQDNLSIILKSPYDWIEDNGEEFQGFTDQEVGLRWRLNRDPNLAAAVQGNLIIPLGLDSSEDPVSSNQEVGVELSVPVTRSFQLDQQRYGYGTVEVGYRDYFGPSSDELRVSGEVSVDVVRRLAIATQFFGIYHLQNTEDDDFTKLGGQLRWNQSDRLTFVVGGFKNISGEGSGFEAQIWYRFGSERSKSSPLPPPPIEPSIPSAIPQSE